ncbi:ABC-2 type transport system ATP-binding protein [Caldanaerobius fijiensis DSM 17918]|uniref:ABC-2 type transport system ATP-binding protein n=1 Tax=Caldanaerobius fijiensis DSM 17918 TaxID=1121256 RepID=A0A1M5CN53_9THEO|nr:ABC transporter ATP-binding protein [Caldanaerobius fijiensis]SHF56096.1 ABC-2 type transport system ATP-binding protein [Caldanaerobius fijiensis DSM 17918]
MIIETYNLTKQFNGKGGFCDINLTVDSGQVFGFLGPNGAGKSTFVKTLVGLLYPTSGLAYILGKPLGDVTVREKIGFLPEGFKYHDWMTGKELMEFHAQLYKIKNPSKRIEELIELVKLKGHESKRIKNYSKGMQQRIGLAIALLPDPDVVFLDEPTSALDPVGRIEVREIIKGLKAMGKTVFLNSHLLSEVEMVCDEVAIINHGHIIAKGRLDELLKKTTRVEITAEGVSSDLVDKLSSMGDDFQIRGNTMVLTVKNRDDIPLISKIVVESGARLYELKNHTDSLEELFITLLGKDEQNADHH